MPDTAYEALADRFEVTAPAPKPGDRKYYLTSTGDSSAKYGACEVCAQPATEVFHQWAAEFYADDHEGRTIAGWGHVPTVNRFGHKCCLVGQRVKGGAA